MLQSGPSKNEISVPQSLKLQFLPHCSSPQAPTSTARISRTAILRIYVPLIPRRIIKNSTNITNRNHTEKPRRPDPRLVRVIRILVLVCEFAIVGYDVAVLHAVDLVAYERAGGDFSNGEGIWRDAGIEDNETWKEGEMTYLMLISSTRTPPHGLPGVSSGAPGNGCTKGESQSPLRPPAKGSVAWQSWASSSQRVVSP